ncbi:MAG: Gfo/Idh/MocA family oxidoreductase [Trueperaceae bacterium]|nr:Gfo/Idh/MocA family oxidoreductase [Trueperaceae bacterium]
MNLALIGPGAMGEEHALAFARLGGVTPYVVAGPNEAQVREFAAAHGFGRFTLEPQEALTDPHVDIVVISSPNDFHAAQARTAIEHGKHVLIEIPVAMSLSDAEELAALARASSGVVMAAHISRYYPAVRRLRRQVEEGALTLRHLICSMGTDKRENRNWKGAERDWVDDLLWHHGLHVLDAVMHLFDNDLLVESKLTTGGRHPRHGGVMDAAVTLRFESGALATVALTYHAKKQFTRYAVVADETHIELAQDAPGAGAADLTEGRPFSELVDAQDGEFLAACRAGRPPPVPLDAVLPAMRLLHDLTSR